MTSLIPYYILATTAHGYKITASHPRGCTAGEFLSTIHTAVGSFRIARASRLFTDPPELAGIPDAMADDGTIRIATLSFLDIPDPIHLGRGDTGNHPCPVVAGTTRLAVGGDIHEDEPEPFAIIVTATHIHFALLRQDPLFWSLRGRATLATENGRPNQ